MRPKGQIAQMDVLDRLNAAGCGRLSVQCLAEFFSAVTRGPAPILAIAEAVQQTNQLAQAWPVLEMTPMIVLEAARGVREPRFAYRDAQTWASARLNRIPVVFSEDFADGAVFDGVRFINPFAAGFVVELWI